MDQVITVALRIDAKIAAGILRGIYVRDGGVVRDAVTGVIVKHLDEAAQAVRKAGLASMGFDVIKKIPKGAVVAVIGVVSAGLVYKFMRAPIVKCAMAFQTSLADYLEAVSTGVDVDVHIVTFRKTMAELRVLSTSRQFSWVLSKKQADDLLRVLNQYTLKLAEANDVEVGTLPNFKSGEVDDLLTEIDLYLQAQARVFDADGQDDLKPND